MTLLMQLPCILLFGQVLLICHEHVHALSALRQAVNSTEPSANKTNALKSEPPPVRCNSDKNCQGHSYCHDGDCLCEKGWMKWHDSRPCSYKQSSRILAFLLSFLMGLVGVDWFMLSRRDSLYILCGILKLLLCAGCCIWNPLAARSKSRTATTAASCLSVTLTLIAFIWWFVDWLRVLLGTFPDGNGAPLV